MEYKINTLLPIQFEKIENPPYLNDSRFQAVKCYVAHEKENYNGSYFDLSTLEEMAKNMAGVPIVGYISVDNLNEKDFNGHEEKLTIKDNNISIEYLGRAYGCVISNSDVSIEDRLHADGKLRKYLCVTGVLWKMFADCIDIFDKNTSQPQSMELQEDSISGKFEKDGHFHFTQAKVRALCILSQKIPSAMSNSVIETFSKDGMDKNIKELLLEVNNSIKQFSLENKSHDLILTENQFERGEIKDMEENQVNEVLENTQNIEENFESKPAEEIIENFENIKVDEKVEVILEEFENQNIEVVIEEAINENESNSDFELIQIENESLKLKISEYELKINSLSEEKTGLESQISDFTKSIVEKDSVINILEKYKSDNEFAKKEDLVNSIIEEFETVLKDNTEFEVIKKNAMSMDVENLKKELYALEGMSKHKFSINKPKKQISMVNLDSDSNETDMANVYGSASKYLKDKK